jgi:hypothetical protein
LTLKKFKMCWKAAPQPTQNKDQMSPGFVNGFTYMKLCSEAKSNKSKQELNSRTAAGTLFRSTLEHPASNQVVGSSNLSGCAILKGYRGVPFLFVP